MWVVLLRDDTLFLSFRTEEYMFPIILYKEMIIWAQWLFCSLVFLSFITIFCRHANGKDQPFIFFLHPKMLLSDLHTPCFGFPMIWNVLLCLILGQLVICFTLRPFVFRTWGWGERAKTHLEERRKRREVCPPFPVRWRVEFWSRWNPENIIRFHYKARLKRKLFFSTLHLEEVF